MDNSSWYNEENYNYIRQYILGKISIKDVPLANLNSFILEKAAKREPDVLIELLLNLNKNGNYTFDTLDGLRWVSKGYQREEYYYRYFLLDPLNNYLKLPRGKRTEKMSFDLISLNPQNIKYVLNNHKNKKMCDMAFAYDPKLVVYMPDKYIDESMYMAYIKRMTSIIKVDIDASINRDSLDNWEEYLSFLRNVPNEYIPNNLYEILFKINPLLFVAFDDNVKTYSMCKKIYEMYGDLLDRFIPLNKLWDIKRKKDTEGMSDDEKREYYYDKFKNDPVNWIDKIPLKYRNQKFYDRLFFVGKMNVIDKIPMEYRTQEMWDMIVFCSNDSNILKEVPEQFMTHSMCNYIYQTYGTDALFDIPDKYMNKEMFLDFLDNKLYKYIDKSFKFLTIEMLDEEVFSRFIVYLKNIIKEGKTVDVDFDVIKVIVNLYPYLIKAFDKENVQKIIMEELYTIILKEGTIENIANKYCLSVSYVNGVLEKMKEVDSASYEIIKNILEHNQSKWFNSIQKDVGNLDVILSLLGDFKSTRIDSFQKVKFSYLYSKYINHSLKDIFNFNYKKYNNMDCSRIDDFFKYVLKYDYLPNNMYMCTFLESSTFEFNNDWLSGYDRDKFFVIKNGIATMERRYGKESKLLTLDIEKEVIDELKINDIPLSNIIVQCAFREYFNNNLESYIKQFKEYDIEFENVKKRRDRK